MIIHSLINFIFPPHCPLCDVRQDEFELCDDCDAAIVKIESDYNAPHLMRRWFDRAESLFAYDGDLAHAIHKFKYEAALYLVTFFVKELTDRVSMRDYDLIIPVPLYKRRLFSRGYNPAAELAKKLGKRIDTKVDLHLLKRVIKGKQQVGLHVKERLENQKGLYAVDDNSLDKLSGRNILLIDDVLTTGATVNECAKVLKKGGAKQVDLITLARTC
ncbi:MAG: ComF family protein [Pseudomonadota bacterium]